MTHDEMINICWDVFDMTDASMGAVINFVLEEAAKAVEGNAVEGASGLHRGRSGKIVWDPESAYGHGRFEAAKDIRALKGE